mmetsp:Transcript_15445/g.26536  ORF Transcript_15445/g.26536 Transcript_15445/m.26536 type:complete len:292 (-) Transcript_15445:1276-2151(-)
MFQHIGLCSYFGMSCERLKGLVSMVASNYSPNPFHSFDHAVDVTHALFSFLVRLPAGLLDPSEVLSLLLSALVHDVGHDGHTNAFHVASRSVLVATYGEASVQENYHVCLGRSIIEASDLLNPLSHDDLTRFWELNKAAILATDIARHDDILADFKAAFGTTPFKGSQLPKSKRTLLAAVLLKCADVSNVARGLDNNKRWGLKLQAEFFQQGDHERELGLNVSPGMERIVDEQLRSVALLKSQVFFINRFAAPLYRAVADVFPSLRSFADNVEYNLSRWDSLLSHTHAPSC